jgi:hypothetical protein
MSNDYPSRTGAIAIKYVRKYGRKTGLARTVDSNIRKHSMSLNDAKEKTFHDLAIPKRFYSFYGEYYNSPIFEIVVVDGGRGVYETLKRIYMEKHNGKEGIPFEVLQYAFEEGATCKTYKDDLFDFGHGLYDVKKQALEWNGIVEMRSCQSRITFSNDYPEGISPDTNDKLKETIYFPGTQLRVLIPESGYLPLFQLK